MNLLIIKTMLTPEEVRYIANLARLNLSEEEVQKYAKQLSSILDYAEILKEVDTENVKPISQITGLNNVKREDVVNAQGLSDELIGCTPQGVEQGQVKVKKVF